MVVGGIDEHTTSSKGMLNIRTNHLIREKNTNGMQLIHKSKCTRD